MHNGCSYGFSFIPLTGKQYKMREHREQSPKPFLLQTSLSLSCLLHIFRCQKNYLERPKSVQEFLAGEYGAPIMLIRSTTCVLIPAQRVWGLEVTVSLNLLNLADHLTIFSVNGLDQTEAVAGVYWNKTKYLTILYTNLSQHYFNPGKNYSSCMVLCVKLKKEKPLINAVQPVIKEKMLTDQLWKDLHLENNEVLWKVPELKKKSYSKLNTYQDVFTNYQYHVVQQL